MKCEVPRCDHPAEVEWIFPDRAMNIPAADASHRLCGGHATALWSDITLKYPGSAAATASTFRPIGDPR